MSEPDEPTKQPSKDLTFWDHLEVLRGSLIKMVVAAAVLSVVAFCFKDLLFDVVLAPSKSNFFVYRWLRVAPFSLHLINTGLAEQMLVHLKVSTVAGLLVASPYIIFLLFRFISPALYENERRHSVQLTVSAYVMFIVGVLVNYLIIFPFTVRFLGTYQVSEEVQNMLTIGSYADALLSMSLIFGIVFELPVIAWLLARFGMLRAAWMREYRRHAIVAILIVAAIITPTADVLTLLVVSVPIWLLYESSIWIVKATEKKVLEDNSDNSEIIKS